MRAQPRVKPGLFKRGTRQFLAHTRVPRELNIIASEVTEALSKGEVQVERIRGCKAVALDDLFQYVDRRAGSDDQ